MMDKIYRYINEYKKFLILPMYIPLTPEELNEVEKSQLPLIHMDNTTDTGIKINNIKVKTSDLAVEKREYQTHSLKRVNYTILSEESAGDMGDWINEEFINCTNYYDSVKHRLIANLKYQIYSDDTEIPFTFECDPWKWWKEKLHITKWIPIKQKTIRIEGRVLYPKLNIQFPHNTHTVKFKIS